MKGSLFFILAGTMLALIGIFILGSSRHQTAVPNPLPGLTVLAPTPHQASTEANTVITEKPFEPSATIPMLAENNPSSGQTVMVPRQNAASVASSPTTAAWQPAVPDKLPPLPDGTMPPPPDGLPPGPPPFDDGMGPPDDDMGPPPGGPPPGGRPPG